MYSRIKTVRELFTHFTAMLGRVYPEQEARSIAYRVLEETLGYDKIRMTTSGNDLLPASVSEQTDHILHQLLSHKPLQYVLGFADFYGLRLYVNESVLIPRPETEELVQWILSSADKQARILDIGTGSGCIPIALKKKLPQAFVAACDVSAEALSVAQKNAKEQHTEVYFFGLDILSEQALAVIGEQDIIVSNPPYIPESEQAEIDRHVLDFEPHLALFVSDDDPLLFYRRIASLAKVKLCPGGQLFFEVHADHGKAVLSLLETMQFRDAELRKDLYGRDRMIRANV